MDPITTETNANGRQQHPHWSGYGHATPQGSDGYRCPNMFVTSLGAGGLILFKCTTLDDLLLSFCKRSEGGLLRLISLPEITEPVRGRMALRARSIIHGRPGSSLHPSTWLEESGDRTGVVAIKELAYLTDPTA